jgi:O-antigen/teichoic acid export membrane protein
MSSIESDNLEIDQQVASLRVAQGDIAAHATERDRRLRSSVLTALLLKPLSLLSPLITMPLFLGYLGQEEYGLFLAIVGMATLLSLSNVGVQQGLVNRLIDCHVSGDRELARRYISSLFLALGAILAAGLVLWTITTLFVNWTHVFDIAQPRTAAITPWVVWITGASMLVGFALCIPFAVYTAYQEQSTAYVWDGLAKLLTLLASIAVVYTKFGLIGVAIATCVAPLIVFGVNSLVFFVRRPWFRPRLADFDASIVRSTVGDGFYMFMLQMGVLIMFQCDKFIIGALVSTADVTPYALLGQIFIMAYGLFLVLLGPLTPAYGEAFRRGDIAWVRRHLRWSLAAGIVLMIVCAGMLLVFGDWIIRRWLHGKIPSFPHPLIYAMTALFVLRIWIDCRSAILNPANILRPQVKFFVANVVLNLILALVLVKPFRVAGVAWATPIAGLLTTGWGYPWLLEKSLRERQRSAA